MYAELIWNVFLSLQLLEANSMKGAVELLDVRPEQLTSADVGEQQVGGVGGGGGRVGSYGL